MPCSVLGSRFSVFGGPAVAASLPQNEQNAYLPAPAAVLGGSWAAAGQKVTSTHMTYAGLAHLPWQAAEDGGLSGCARIHRSV